MNLLFPFLFCSVIFCQSAVSQKLDLISASGTETTSATGSVSWSIGEVVILTGSNGTNEFTQGFHQSNIWILGVEDLLELEISIFPNPTCDNVNIVTEDEAILIIYDMNGRLVSTHNLIKDMNQIDVSLLSRGIYNLVFQSSENITKSAKLIVQ